MNQIIKVLSVNVSEKKGTIKKPVDFIRLSRNGVEKDAHAGPWNRQVSLLGKESIDKFSKEAGRDISFGEFAENITTEGLKLYKTLPLDRFVSEHVELEVTQIGKHCHGKNCQIFQEVGNCVMPKEGIFARVIREGKMQAGVKFEYKPRVIKTTVITLSDRAFHGLYADKSGKKIEKRLGEFWTSQGRKSTIDYVLIPDDEYLLEGTVREAVQNGSDFIFTTGGTGIGPKDITPDVVKPMLDKEIPGIMDLIRIKYGSEKPAALISRSVAGVIGQTLVYCLPGSQKAVDEYLDEILKTVTHSLYMIHRLDIHA
ncbi:MAG: molybdenum cofactor synthesis protein [Chlorobi bacterium]|nr:molybdenum cofactor synthesis protein [Chlorobiota bacterium]